MKFKKIMSAFLACSLALAPAVAVGGIQDTMVVCAANDTLKNASDISNGREVKTGLTDKVKTLCYKYKAADSGYVQFDVTRAAVESTNEPVWKATVYNSAGEQLSYASGTTFYTQPTMVERDTLIYVTITSSGGSSTEKFILTPNFVQSDNVIVEPADEITSAKTIDFGRNYFGVIDDSTDADFLKIKSDEAGYVKMRFARSDYNSTQTPSWNLTFYDSELTELYSVTTQTVLDKLNTESLYYAMPADKTIYVKISGGTNATGVLYSFGTSFTSTSLVESEPNNSFGTADSIKPSKKYRGALAEQATGDYFVIKAKKSGKHVVSVNLSNEIAQGYKVTVYDASRNELVSASDIVKKGSIAFKAVKGKKYYVVLEHTSGYSASVNALYKLKVTAK